jgi:hypothetical protein
MIPAGNTPISNTEPVDASKIQEPLSTITQFGGSIGIAYRF